MNETIEQPAAPPVVKTPTQLCLETFDRKIAWLKERRDWIHRNSKDIEDLGVQVSSGFFETIDFDHLPHLKIIEVIRTFGGKWTKRPCPGQDGRINYETTVDGVKLRCWAGEPPPSCQIVEVEEEVPARPATTRKVRKLICPQTEVAAAVIETNPTAALAEFKEGE